MEMIRRFRRGAVSSEHCKQASGSWALIQTPRQVSQINFGSQTATRVWVRIHRRWDISHWRLCVFSDEYRFTLFHSDSRARERHRQRERLINTCIQPTDDNRSPSAMVWVPSAIVERVARRGWMGTLKRQRFMGSAVKTWAPPFFTDFSITIKIWWKFLLHLIQILIMWSLQNVAQVTSIFWLVLTLVTIYGRKSYRNVITSMQWYNLIHLMFLRLLPKSYPYRLLSDIYSIHIYVYAYNNAESKSIHGNSPVSQRYIYPSGEHPEHRLLAHEL